MTANTDTTYRIKGGRVGVLLIHGLCGTPAEVRFVAQGIARAGYTVHCPMIAGHGRSIWSLKASTWQEWLESMEAALVELRRECDVVICGGLSTGAVLSLMLAARHPDLVQGTALFSPTLWINGWSIPWYARLFKLVRFRWLAGLMDFDDMEPYGIKDDRVREFAYGALQSGDGSMGLVGTPGIALLEHRRLVAALIAQLSRIEQPVLIVHPREDDCAHLDNAWYLQKQLKGMVEMVVLDDSYHMVTIDRQRHVVVDRTIGFMDRVVERLAIPAARAPQPLRARHA